MTITTTQTLNQKAAKKGGKERAPIIPKENAPFTLGQIKGAIPPHLFKHSMLKSFSYLGVDLLESAIWLFLIIYLDGLTKENTLLNWTCWVAYWFYQGLTWTGIWVLAHECGHGGFVAQEWLNDTVGFIFHTALYVPYFSWKFSHAKHHHYTNHMTQDEPFVPYTITPEQRAKVDQGELPHPNKPSLFALYERWVIPFVMLFLGWPLYLSINASGPPKKDLVSHYDPKASIFNKKDWWKIVLSDLGLVAWTLALWKLGETFGFGLVAALYIPPVLVTNSYLVAITFLQHTDDILPHYDATEWTWLRGALCTVDRSLGWFGDYKTHHIVDTHVTHHIFSYLPFYNAEEATKAIKPVLKEYHCEDKRGFFHFWYLFFKTAAENSVVDNETDKSPGIFYFFREEIKHGKAH